MNWNNSPTPPVSHLHYPTLVARINGMFTRNRLISTSKRGKRKHCSNIGAKNFTGKKCQTLSQEIIGLRLHLTSNFERSKELGVQLYCNGAP
jgi:hypothetical protein